MFSMAFFEDHGLLLGEVDELRDVAEMGRLLVEADAVAGLLDDKPRFTEGIDVPVDGPPRHVEPLGQLVDVVGGVGGEQLHEPQQSFELGLVHAGYVSSCCILAAKIRKKS